MKIIRARNTQIIDVLAPHLLHDEDEPLEETLQMLETILTQAPSTIFIVAAFDDDVPEGEDFKLLAFLIGTAPAGRSYAWLWQAWRTPEKEVDQIARSLFKRFVGWVDLQERKTIRMETRRSPEAFTRAWNFKPLATVMGYSLEEEFGETLNKEPKNVSQRIDKFEELPVEKSASGGESVEQGHPVRVARPD